MHVAEYIEKNGSENCPREKEETNSSDICIYLLSNASKLSQFYSGFCFSEMTQD